MKDVQIEYYELKPVFLSAYNNCHKDIEFALTMTANYTGKNRSEIATILKPLIKKLNEKIL